MKKSVLIVGAIGTGLALLAYKGVKIANAVQLLKTSVEGIKHVSSNFTHTTLHITLSVFNPTATPVSFDRIYAQVRVAGNLLGELDIDGAGRSFGAAKATQVVVPLIVSHVQAAATMANIIQLFIQKRPIDTPFDVAGTLYAGGLQLPIAATVRLSDYIKPPRIAGVNDCFKCLI